MKILFHDDIVKPISAFTIRMADPDSASNLLETLAVHRVANLKLNTPNVAVNNGPAYQVAMTLIGTFQTSDDPGINLTQIEAHTFKPENIEEDNIRTTLLNACSQGSFVPILVAAEPEDLLQDANNVLSVVVGIGELPEANFMMMTINIPKMISDMENDGMTYIYYPLVFDAVSKVIGSIYPKEVVATRSFMLAVDEPKLPTSVSPEEFTKAFMNTPENVEHDTIPVETLEKIPEVEVNVEQTIETKIEVKEKSDEVADDVSATE